MKKPVMSVFTLFLGAALLLGTLPAGALPAAAQAPALSAHPTGQPGLPGAAEQLGEPYAHPDPNAPWFDPSRGLWMSPGRPGPQAAPSPQETGGPDDFGYTWDDSVPLDWIDASGGTDTGLGSGNPHTGPIDLPFSFKYYENTHAQLWISLHGFLAFNDNNLDVAQANVPSASLPNDVVAPHWVPADSADGYIRYLSGGSAPNRWFVVEWNHLRGWEGEDYTFEVVLLESSDVMFQYLTMDTPGGYFCQASGIEDSTGLDGLSVTDFCEAVAPDHAVYITRPAPAARVRITPLYQGRFSRSGATESFQLPIRNTGDLGADTYDLSVASAWTASLFEADGVTPLTDTDSDGVVDTGPVAQGSTAVVVAKVETPVVAGVGDHSTAALTATSSLDPGKSRTAALQTAVPAPFAQVYRDSSDAAMGLYLAQPAGQALKKTTPDWFYGSHPAVAETTDGFVYLWYRSRTVGGAYASEIEYLVADRYGDTVRPLGRLTDHSGATVSTYDYAPEAAVAPDGRIGVTWYRYVYDPSLGYNYNIWMAILGPDGSPVYGPANVTNNDEWGWSGDYDYPRFLVPTIAATTDNCFVLAWWKEYEAAPGGGCSEDCWFDDVYYAVRDSAGGEVRAITPFTADTPGYEDGYYYPNLADLDGSRVLLTYYRNADQDLYYAVLDGDGDLVLPAANLVGDGTGVYDRQPDAAQLSDGTVLVAWTAGNYPEYHSRFAVLDAAYNLVAGPTDLVNPATTGGNAYVSVAADAAGHGTVTWIDYGDYVANLYYALVDGSGSQVNPPMIFRSVQSPGAYMYTSYYGNGNTSYSWTPPEGVDGVVGFGRPTYAGVPGGEVALDLHYANHGATVATDVVLVATLDDPLTYVGDTSGVVPVVSGQEVTWNLPDLTLLERHDFVLTVQVSSDAAPGAAYPVELSLSSDGPEVNPADNTAGAQVEVRARLYLPLVMRGFDPTLLFFDDFSDPSSGWGVDPTGNPRIQYVDGEYEVSFLGSWPPITQFAPIAPVTGNYSVEFDARQTEGSTGGYGFIFEFGGHSPDFWSSYWFTAYPGSQGYDLWRYDWGWTWLAGGSSPYINPGSAANHLKLEREGDLLALYANGHLLTAQVDGTYRSGEMALYLWPSDSETVTVRFDNLEVRNLGGAKVGSDLLSTQDSAPWPPMPIPDALRR